MIWDKLNMLSMIILPLWLAGSVLLFFRKNNVLKIIGHMCVIGGIALLTYFTVDLWVFLERPPMRTLGETRLWYSLFLSAIGYIIMLRKKYIWMLWYSLGMAALFLIINVMRPEIHDKDLMPALQSPWFVPHVVVYLLSYALLGVSAFVGLLGVINIYRKKAVNHLSQLADNVVYIGFALLTMGLLFGALWAKEAWGHYWTWDPKEVWALITWLVYLLYIHLRYSFSTRHKWAFWSLLIAFIMLLVCWFGLNYLPVAENSVHTYSG
jgi:ABC-type transport system involved in cytochrome c biogenesis permease subunit